MWTVLCPGIPTIVQNLPSSMGGYGIRKAPYLGIGRDVLEDRYIFQIYGLKT